MRLLRALPVALVVLSGCSPRSVAEAEAKRNVAWLEQQGTSDAINALGRLADKDAKALAIVQARAAIDPQVYSAAWEATLRESPWGAPMLKEALGDPTRAELAAARMNAQDARIGAFMKELEDALVRLSATSNNGAIARALASIGAPARAAVERRLADGSTRGGMCRGIGAPDSSADARGALMSAPTASRDHALCVEAVLAISGDDEASAWLATRAEPGLLGAAGKSEVVKCERLKSLWARALQERPAETHPALVVPLNAAAHRCAGEIDAVMADALARLPATHALVLNAIEPFDPNTKSLKATCKALPKIESGQDARGVRERAHDAMQSGCRM